MTTKPTYQFLALRSGRSDRTKMIYPLNTIMNICNSINASPPMRPIYVTDSAPDLISYTRSLLVDPSKIIGQVTSAEVVHGNLFVTVTPVTHPTLSLNAVSTIAVVGTGAVDSDGVVAEDYILSHLYAVELTPVEMSNLIEQKGLQPICRI